MSDRTVKLTSKLPQGDANGLADPDIVADLIRDPARLRIGIVVFDVSGIETDTDTGTQTAKVRVRRFEVVRDDRFGDASALERLLMRATERRTGRETLDSDLEDEVRAAFDAIRLDDESPPDGPTPSLFGDDEPGQRPDD